MSVISAIILHHLSLHREFPLYKLKYREGNHKRQPDLPHASATVPLPQHLNSICTVIA